MRSPARAPLAPLAAALVLFAACDGTGVRSVDPQTIVRHDPTKIATPHVPAGTSFRVEMLAEVGTDISREGDPFVAVVLDPLVAPDGTLVVERGARVSGNVADVDTGLTPKLALDFVAVDTVRGGAAPIAVKVEGAEEVEIAGRPDLDPTVPNYDATFYPPATATFPAGTGPISPPRYLHPSVLQYDADAGDLRLPRGAELRVTLTRAIVP